MPMASSDRHFPGVSDNPHHPLSAKNAGEEFIPTLPADPHDIEPEKAGIRIGTTGTRSCENRTLPARTRAIRIGARRTQPEEVNTGKAAWYGLVGNHTSSGEMLDTVTATAAASHNCRSTRTPR